MNDESIVYDALDRDAWENGDDATAWDAFNRILTERDALRKSRDEAQLSLRNLQMYFEDWKVYHSTTRMEVEILRLKEQLSRQKEDLQYIEQETIERCARILDSVNNFDNPMTAGDCADAIRRLKSGITN